MELEELNGENIIWQQVVGLRTEYYFNEVLFVQLDLQSKVSFLAYSHDQTLKVIKRFLYLLFFFFSDGVQTYSRVFSTHGSVYLREIK